MAKVLVVDDDLEMREGLYDALSSKGHEVSTAGTGVQALEMLKGQRPEAVLLNVTLPGGLSGLETAERIRGFDDAVPIILCRDAQAAEVASEPMQRLKIAEVVDRALGPVGLVERVEQLLKRAGGAKAQQTGIGSTLLVIDDDTQVQSLLKHFFQKKGLRVLTASSGEEGLKALAQKPVLILLDINMPGMDGVMALKKIKQQQPTLPVVMISGGGEEKMARAALALGAHDYISKPFSLEYLETIVLSKVMLGIEG